MEIVNALRLERFARKNASSRAALARWVDIVQQARWKHLQDIRRTLPSTDGVLLPNGTAVTIFNIGGNNVRVVAVVDYNGERVFIRDVLTHAEYSKDQWKYRS